MSEINEKLNEVVDVVNIQSKVIQELENKKINSVIDEINELGSQMEHIENKSNNFIYIEYFKTETNTYDEALELCLNYAIENKIKRIVFPPKQMTFYNNHIISNNILYWDMIFEGSGIGIDGRGTEFKFLGNGCFLTVDLTLPTAGTWRGVHFKNISFVGNATNDLVYLLFNQQSTITNCAFTNCNYAIIMSGNTHYTDISNCRFITCNKAIIAPNSGETYFVSGGSNNNKIDNCFFSYCENPIYQTGGSGWLIQNTDFEGYNGTIKLKSNNRFINVRMERNKQGVYLELYNNNHIECDVHGSGGGIACNPAIHFKANNNICYISGNGYEVVTSDIGLYNKIFIKDWKVLETQIMMNNLIKTVDIESFNYPLSSVSLNDFTKTNFTYSSDTGQIVKTGEGYMLYNYTPTTDRIYVTLTQKVTAGGGFRFSCNGKSIDIVNNFPTIDSGKISVYQFNVNKGVPNEIKITCSSGNGSAITIKDFKISDNISNYLFK